jgi:hypothetical protein
MPAGSVFGFDEVGVGVGVGAGTVVPVAMTGVRTGVGPEVEGSSPHETSAKPVAAQTIEPASFLVMSSSYTFSPYMSIYTLTVLKVNQRCQWSDAQLA